MKNAYFPVMIGGFLLVTNSVAANEFGEFGDISAMDDGFVNESSGEPSQEEDLPDSTPEKLGGDTLVTAKKDVSDPVASIPQLAPQPPRSQGSEVPPAPRQIHQPPAPSIHPPLPSSRPPVQPRGLAKQGQPDIESLQVFKRKPAEVIAFGYPLTSKVPITSRYGWRKHPMGGTRFHQGVDLGAPNGAPVIAAESGVVVRATWYGTYGNTVDIDHGGVVTRYAHLSKIHAAPGMTVGKGTHVGEVGSSGRSTGPHLHFEIIRDGKSIDPLQYLASGYAGVRLPFNPAHIEIAFLRKTGTTPRS